MEDKTVVAVVGMVCATILGVANLYFEGPDAAVLATLIGAITFIAGLAFGYKRGGE